MGALSMTMRRRPLFGEAPAWGQVATALDDHRFYAASYFGLGLRDVWEAALYEVSDLYARFEREGEDIRVLDPLFDLLADRIAVLPDRENARQMFQVVFGFFCPSKSTAATAASIFRRLDEPDSKRPERVQRCR